LARQVASRADALAPALWKQVARLLSSPGFHARAALIPAIARLEPAARGLRVAGMVARAGPDGAAPYLPGLIGGGGPRPEAGAEAAPAGAEAPAGGLVGALADGQWPTRRAAAQCLHALCLELGPRLDRPQARRALRWRRLWVTLTS